MQINAKNLALAIAAFGLLVSIYLTIARFTNATVACPDNSVINCSNVLNSQYSTILGIPNAVLGIMFFVLDIWAVMKYFGKDQMIILNAIGFAFVLYYVFTEYLLKSVCIYCTSVHVSVILLLMISIKYYGRPIPGK